MSSCPRCGVDIRWAINEPTGERLMLERIPAAAGKDRYREVGYDPLRVQGVTETAACLAYPKHGCYRR